MDGICAALAALSVAFERGKKLESGYILEVAICKSNLVLEVDGPTRFTLPDGLGLRRPTGATLLRRRQLAALQWKVWRVHRVRTYLSRH